MNDSDVCLSYRQRGYRVYVFNISLDHIVRWKWYLENQSRAFIQRSYGQGEHFHSVIRDYVRLLLLYRYGGTFLSLDTVILRPLPNTEFIESDGNGTCCALKTTGLYEASDLMRFRPRRLFLWEIFEQTSIDQLRITMTSDSRALNYSLTILVFSRWVTFITKSMGTSDRWSSLRRLIESIDTHFPRSDLRIGSDSGTPINRTNGLLPIHVVARANDGEHQQARVHP